MPSSLAGRGGSVNEEVGSGRSAVGSGRSAVGSMQSAENAGRESTDYWVLVSVNESPSLHAVVG
jgi:hypothetical protein